MAELEGLFAPERVAVVGATGREGSVGRAVFENLVGGFSGDVVPVNPNRDAVLGVPCVPTVADAGAVDLAVLAVPARAVPGVLREVGEAGIEHVVVISSGFAEAGEAGAALEADLESVAARYGLTLVGPNSVGVLSTPVGLNATFAPTTPNPGSVSMLSQSGAFVTAALDWATDRGIGFRHVVSLGNEAVVSETDLLAYWGEDPDTEVILGYVEAIDDGRRFVETARSVTAGTPVVLLKAGRSAAGARAAASHTGSMAGSDRAYEAGFRRAGVVRADTVEALFDAGEALAGGSVPAGDAVAVVTNAGGPGVLASDAIAESHLSMAEFAPSTVDRLEALLPDHGSATNPLDLLGDADVDRIRRGLDAVLEDPNVDAVVFLSAPTALVDYDALASAIVDARAGHGVPVVACLMGGERVEPAAARLRAAGIPNAFDPARAVQGLDALSSYGAVRDRPDERPRRFDVAGGQVDELLAEAATRPGGRLSVEGTAFLDAVGVPTPRGGLAETAAEADEIAERLGRPVAMKVASPDVLHKSDVGGVALDVPPTEAGATFETLVGRVGERRPDATVLGVRVEAQVPTEGGVETIVGVTRDPQFGPLVLFGLGGIFVQVLEDVSVRVAPVSEREAREMTADIGAAAMLRGARGREPVDLDAVVEVICRLAQVAVDHPTIRELDVNPLLATPSGVTALDFRLTVDPQER